MDLEYTYLILSYIQSRPVLQAGYICNVSSFSLFINVLHTPCQCPSRTPGKYPTMSCQHQLVLFNPHTNISSQMLPHMNIGRTMPVISNRNSNRMCSPQSVATRTGCVTRNQRLSGWFNPYIRGHYVTALYMVPYKLNARENRTNSKALNST